KGILYGIGIKVLIHIRCAVSGLAVVAAAHRLGFDRPTVFHPTEVVNNMDIVVAEASSSGPQETMEAPDLVFQVGDIGRLRQGGEMADEALHAVAAHQDDLA